MKKSKFNPKNQEVEPKKFDLNGVYLNKYWTLKRKFLLFGLLFLTALVICLSLIPVYIKKSNWKLKYWIKLISNFLNYQIDEDKCGNLKCLNNGICKLNNNNEPYCECLQEYNGSNCQTCNLIFIFLKLFYTIYASSEVLGKDLKFLNFKLKF